jgi:nanoRNase/pAp phosphatase (c-di-AMP/oligoRNAs hydrolase)
MNPTSSKTDSVGVDARNHAGKLLRFLDENRTSLSPMLILAHDFPDPDALAAAFGLQHLLQAGFGIESRIAYRGEIGRTENRAMVRLLKIPIRKLSAGWLKRCPNVALVDTQPSFENNPFPTSRRASLVIDQHPSDVVPQADLAIVDPNCGATCVIVGCALLQRGLEIPERVATALAYGILTDTLGLYRAHRQDVVDTYLQVLSHADVRMLARIQNPVRTRKFFATLSQGIRGATMYRRLLVSHLGTVETPDLVSQVAEFLLAYRRAAWCLVTGRYKGRLYASLRTNVAGAAAGEVLRESFGSPRAAGGHGVIAGGSCRVAIDATEETWQARELNLEERLRARLRIPNRVKSRKPFDL